MKAIPKKVTSVTAALALSLSMAPTAGFAAEAGSGAGGGTNSDPQIISVTAPFAVTFGSKENPYDVATASEKAEADSYFYNGSDYALSVHGVELESPAWYNTKDDSADDVLQGKGGTTDVGSIGNLFAVETDGIGAADCPDSGKQTVNLGYNTNRKLDLASQSLKTTIGVSSKATQPIKYTLNLSSAQVNKDMANSHTSDEFTTNKDGSANPAEGSADGKHRLGTIKFTFGAYIPQGDLNGKSTEDILNGTGGVPAEAKGFFLRDTTGNQVYSAGVVKKHANDLAQNGTSSVYYGMYDGYRNSDEASYNSGAVADGKYQCQTRWTLDTSEYADTTAITMDNVSTYYLRILDILYDEDASTGDKVGLTFQFINSYNANPKKTFHRMPGDYTPSGNVLSESYKTSNLRANMTPRIQAYDASGNDAGTRDAFWGNDTDEIYNAMPQSVRSNMAIVSKSYALNNAAKSDDASDYKMATGECGLFLPSIAEMQSVAGDMINSTSQGAWSTSTYPWVKYEGPGSTLNSDGTLSHEAEMYHYYAEKMGAHDGSEISVSDCLRIYRYDGSNLRFADNNIDGVLSRTMCPTITFPHEEWLVLYYQMAGTVDGNLSFICDHYGYTSGSWRLWLNPAFCF